MDSFVFLGWGCEPRKIRNCYFRPASHIHHSVEAGGERNPYKERFLRGSNRPSESCPKEFLCFFFPCWELVQMHCYLLQSDSGYWSSFSYADSLVLVIFGAIVLDNIFYTGEIYGGLRKGLERGVCDGGFTLQGVGWRLKMGKTSKRHWKKKWNRLVRRELTSSSNSLVGPLVQLVRFRFNLFPSQLTGQDQNRDQPTVEPVGPAGPVWFLKPCFLLSFSTQIIPNFLAIGWYSFYSKWF